MRERGEREWVEERERERVGGREREALGRCEEGRLEEISDEQTMRYRKSVQDI